MSEFTTLLTDYYNLLTQIYKFWTQTIHPFARACVSLDPQKRRYMDWQDILMIAIAALLLLVWVPVLFIAVHRALREEEKEYKTKHNSDGNKTGV